MSETQFTQLSEAEQRLVAERLLKIEQSNWKPFWCPDPECNGDPHPLRGGLGEPILVDESAVSGSSGEPVGGRVWEAPNGRWIYEDRLTKRDPRPDLPVLGRTVLDPKWAHNHARKDQRLPNWQEPWTLFVMSGRGSGKTRTGVEFVTLNARRGLDGAIVGRRGTELENTHVKALIESAHPDFVPIYLASKDILVWPEVTMPDGSKRTPTTFLFSAERPENIRSVNLSYVWFDEAAFMDEIETAWMNAKFATRVRDALNPIHRLITSTPTSTPWVLKMEDDPTVEIRRVSTYANRKNLSEDFIADLEREFEGTRMGRQEIHGEALRDVEGALWNDGMFKHQTFLDDPAGFEDYLDSLDNRILAIDPAGSKGKRSDATGIIVVGVHHTDDSGARLAASLFSVLGDATLKGSPTEWAERAYKAARHYRVSRIVAEKNFGGDMVKQVLTDYAKLHPDEALDENGDPYVIEVVHAQQSKETRAEATVAKYEQGRVTHVINDAVFGTDKAGDMSMLEKEQTMWVPKSRGGKSPSPNRVDALVWAVRALESKVRYETQMGNQRSIMEQMRQAQTTANRGRATSSPLAPSAPPVPVPPPAPATVPAPAPVQFERPAPNKRFKVKLPPSHRR